MASESDDATMLLLTETIAPALGACLATILFLGPLPAVLEARRRGNLGGLSPSLFPWIVANCYAFLAYGIIKHDVYIVMSNVAGLYLGLFYLLIGHRLASSMRVATKLEMLFIGLALLWGAITVAARWAPDDAEALVGNGAMIMSLCMFAAPLGTMRQVLRERNTVYINLGFLAGQLASCVMWGVYGIATQDTYIIVPNVTGLAFALVQTFLVCTLPRVSAFQLPQHATPVSQMDKLFVGSPGATVSAETQAPDLEQPLPVSIEVGTMPIVFPTVDSMHEPLSPRHVPVSPRQMPSRHASAAQETMAALPVGDMSSPLVTPLVMLEQPHMSSSMPALSLDAVNEHEEGAARVFPAGEEEGAPRFAELHTPYEPVPFQPEAAQPDPLARV